MTKYKVEVEYLLGKDLKKVPNFIIKKRILLWNFIPCGWLVFWETENLNDVQTFLKDII